MHSMLHHQAYKLIGAVGIAAVAACSSEVTSPLAKTAVNVGPAAYLASEGAQGSSHTFYGKHSTFFIDDASSTLRDDKGHSRRLSPRALAKMQARFARIRTMDNVISRIVNDPNYIARLGTTAISHQSNSSMRFQWSSRSVAQSATGAGIVAPPAAASIMAPGARFVPSASADMSTSGGSGGGVSDGSYTCNDILDEINSLTPGYLGARDEYENDLNLIGVDAASAIFDPENIDPTAWVNYENAWARYQMLGTQLDILATMFNVNNCWQTAVYNQPDPGLVDGPGTPDPSGLDGGSYCTDSHITIEISYDNGATWSVIWSGDVLVC